MEAYGGAKCACCGETTPEFLTLDHINGFKSSPNYKQSKRCRGNVYSQIIKDGFPDDLQTLCYNCNCSKGENRQCPHQKNKSQEDSIKGYPQTREDVLYSLEVA